MSLALPQTPGSPEQRGRREGAAPARTAPLLENLARTLLAGYLLSLCFGLPLLRAGPTWALWPTLPDLLLWGAGLCALLYRAPLPTRRHHELWWGLVTVTALCACSYLLLFLYRDARFAVAVNTGLFQLYKLVQVLLVFWTVSRLPLGPDTLERWRRAVTLAFVISVIFVTWTYFSGALPTALGTVLPHGRGVSGPWEAYYLHQETGLGTIGYNHGYVAIQLLMMGILVTLLRPGASNVLLLVLVVVGCFFTGARAGLAGALVFAALEWRRVPVRSAATLVAAALVGLGALPLLSTQSGVLSHLVSRQATLLDANNSSNLAGRTDIWGNYLDLFTHDPYRLLVGSGFGAAANANAHMQLLQVLFEGGLAGVTTYLLLLWLLLRSFWGAGRPGSVMLHAMVAFLFMSLTEEVFYPTSAFSGFLPLLAFTVALSLKPELRRAHEQPPEAQEERLPGQPRSLARSSSARRGSAQHGATHHRARPAPGPE